jgi:hypothetical protein
MKIRVSYSNMLEFHLVEERRSAARKINSPRFAPRARMS